MSRIVLTQAGLTFTEELQQYTNGRFIQTDQLLETGKQADKVVKSRPRILPRVKITDVPEIREFGKYRGFLGPNYTPSKKKRNQSEGLEQVFQKMSRENRSLFSQGSQFRTPLFLDLENFAVHTVSNDENTSNPFGNYVSPQSDHQMKTMHPVQSMTSLSQSAYHLKRQPSMAQEMINKIQHEKQLEEQQQQQMDMISTYNKHRPLRDISTRELSTYRRDLHLITNTKEIQQQLELHNNNELRKQQLRQSYLKQSEAQNKYLKNEVNKNWETRAQPVHVETKFLTVLKEEDKNIEKLQTQIANQKIRQKEKLFKSHIIRWNKGPWLNLHVPGNPQNKKLISNINSLQFATSKQDSVKFSINENRSPNDI